MIGINICPRQNLRLCRGLQTEEPRWGIIHILFECVEQIFLKNAKLNDMKRSAHNLRDWLKYCIKIFFPDNNSLICFKVAAPYPSDNWYSIEFFHWGLLLFECWRVPGRPADLYFQIPQNLKVAGRLRVPISSAEALEIFLVNAKSKLPLCFYFCVLIIALTRSRPQTAYPQRGSASWCWDAYEKR